MERPQVRMIEFQSEETKPANIPSWEAEQLLRKYGHQPEQFTTRQDDPTPPPAPGLSFEEMIAQQEAEERNNQMRRQQQMSGPKPKTFDGGRGYDSEVRYTSDDDSGFGFKIEITTDMQLPRY
jgi:hypothetical protein